jgi:hypothetical protein
MSKGTDHLFASLEEQTGIKRVSDRSYGHLKYTPQSAIVVYVKKKSIAVSFDTEGKSDGLSKDEHIKWAEESGLVSSEVLPGVVFELQEGTKSKSKSTLIAEIPYDDEAELQDHEMVTNIVNVVDLLKEKTVCFSQYEKSKSDHEKAADRQETESRIKQDDAAEAGKYVFVVELQIDAEDYEECEDDSYNPDFTNPLYELTEAFSARVEDTFDCFAPGYLFEDGKPRLLGSPADLWTHVFYAKKDGLIDDMLPQIVILLSGCDHWDYNFIKASQYAEIPGFTVFGYYPNVADIGRQGYCGDDLDTGIYLAEREGDDTDNYTGANSIGYAGNGMNIFDLKPYLEAIAETAGKQYTAT